MTAGFIGPVLTAPHSNRLRFGKKRRLTEALRVPRWLARLDLLVEHLRDIGRSRALDSSPDQCQRWTGWSTTPEARRRPPVIVANHANHAGQIERIAELERTGRIMAEQAAVMNARTIGLYYKVSHPP